MLKSRDGLCAVGTCVLVAALGCSPDLGSAEGAAGRSRGRAPMEAPDAGYEATEACDPNREYASSHPCNDPPEEPAETVCDPTREYAEGHPCNKERSDCWLTGGGKIDGGGSFGGNAKPFRNGWVGGEWNHVTGDGHHFHGSPYPDAPIVCDWVGEPGAGHPVVSVNRAVFFGEGTWDGEPCYFRITVVDHGEPGTADRYSLVVAPNAWTAPFYVGEGLPIAHGNIQIHPLNGGHP